MRSLAIIAVSAVAFALSRRLVAADAALSEAHTAGLDQGIAQARAEFAQDVRNIVALQDRGVAAGQPPLAIRGYDPDEDRFVLVPVVQTVTLQ